MNVKDVVKQAAIVLRLGDAAAYCDDETQTDGKEEAIALLRHYNDTECDAAAYLPLVCEEKVQSVGGKIDLSSLQKNCLQVLSLTDLNGVRRAYKAAQTHLTTTCEAGILRYRYLPKEKALNDKSDFIGVAERAFVYGIVAAYYKGKGLFEEAAVYEKEYRAAIVSVHRMQKGGRLRARRWR